MLISKTGLRINEESIHIHYDKTGRASGEAYVQFQTCEDCEEALKRNMEKIGSRWVISQFFNIQFEYSDFKYVFQVEIA